MQGGGAHGPPCPLEEPPQGTVVPRDPRIPPPREPPLEAQSMTTYRQNTKNPKRRAQLLAGPLIASINPTNSLTKEKKTPFHDNQPDTMRNDRNINHRHKHFARAVAQGEAAWRRLGSGLPPGNSYQQQLETPESTRASQSLT